MGAYHETLDNKELGSLRSEIALVDARLTELIAQLDRGESGDLWSNLATTWEALQRARVTGKGLAERLTEIGEIIGRGAAERERWAEVVELIEQRRRLVETERRTLVEMKQMITAEQAAGLFAAIAEAVKRHVTDRAILAAVSDEFARLVGRIDSPAVGNGGGANGSGSPG